jgi:hypothetical protein
VFLCQPIAACFYPEFFSTFHRILEWEQKRNHRNVSCFYLKPSSGQCRPSCGHTRRRPAGSCSSRTAAALALRPANSCRQARLSAARRRRPRDPYLISDRHSPEAAALGLLGRWCLGRASATHLQPTRSLHVFWPSLVFLPCSCSGAAFCSRLQLAVSCSTS